MKLKRVFALFCIVFASLLVIQSVDAAKIEGKIYDIELNTVSGVKVTLNSVPQQVFVSTDGYYSFTVPEGRYTITADYAKNDLKIREIVVIRDEGTYTLDLILLPDLGIEEDILDEASNIDVSDSYFDKDANTTLRLIIAVGIVIVLVAGIIVWNRLKKNKENKNNKIKAKKKAAIQKAVKKTSKTAVSKKPVNSKTNSAPEVIVDDSDAVEEKKIVETLDSGKDLDALMSFIRKEDGRTTQKDIRKQFPLSEAKISLMIAELEDKGLIKKIKQGRGNIIVLK